MDHEPDIIRANVERFRRMLGQDTLEPSERRIVEKLLAEELAKEPRAQRRE